MWDGVWGLKVKKSSDLDDLGVNAKIILKWNLNKILRSCPR
jgi:hypothetical protein